MKDREKIKAIKNREFEVNHSNFKVKPIELLYDLIFIITIFQIVTISTEGTLKSNFILLLVLFYSIFQFWFTKVKRTNRLYILEEKLNKKIPTLKFLTYVEMLIIIIFIKNIIHFTAWQAYLATLVLLMFFALIYHRVINAVLKYNYLGDDQGYKNAKRVYHQIRQREVNYEHIIERIGIIIILFLGEILKLSFMLDFSTPLFLLIIIVIFNSFSAYFVIIERIETKYGDRRFTFINNICLSPIFIIMLSLIIILEQSHHYHHLMVIPIYLILIGNKIYQRGILMYLGVAKLCMHEIFAFWYYLVVVSLVFFSNINSVIISILVLIIGLIEQKRNITYKKIDEKRR